MKEAHFSLLFLHDIYLSVKECWQCHPTCRCCSFYFIICCSVWRLNNHPTFGSASIDGDKVVGVSVTPAVSKRNTVATLCVVAIPLDVRLASSVSLFHITHSWEGRIQCRRMNFFCFWQIHHSIFKLVLIFVDYASTIKLVIYSWI